MSWILFIIRVVFMSGFLYFFMFNIAQLVRYGSNKLADFEPFDFIPMCVLGALTYALSFF